MPRRGAGQVFRPGRSALGPVVRRGRFQLDDLGQEFLDFDLLALGEAGCHEPILPLGPPPVTEKYPVGADEIGQQTKGENAPVPHEKSVIPTEADRRQRGARRSEAFIRAL